MPLKPHPTDPDKMAYVSRWYDIPQLQGVTTAQPAQEPVAWVYQEYCDGWRDEIQFVQPPNDPNYFRDIVPVYTAPPQRTWVGLTDGELSEFDVDPIEAKLMIAKLKEKNT